MGEAAGTFDEDGAVCPFSGARMGGGVAKAPVSRRAVLAGMAAAAAIPALPGVAAAADVPNGPSIPAPDPTSTPDLTSAGVGSPHASGIPRGADIAARFGRARQGRYGLLFPGLEAYAPSEESLVELAGIMVDKRQPLSDVGLSKDGKDNRAIPAGYIYFGQFIDHDMTRDATPIELAKADPFGTVNFDSPTFDLGCMYGEGPAANPELYDPDQHGKLLLTADSGVLDMPRREDGTAIIGDPRNDENLIVANFQIAMIRFHNSFIDDGYTFGQAQTLTRYHYQWLIVNDFLKRWCGSAVVSRAMAKTATGWKATSRFYNPRNTQKPWMPIEFSAAAYRFGHSAIRAEYEIHNGRTVPIFGEDGFDLRGSRPLPPHLDLDWNYFFEIPGIRRPDDRNYARHIDPKLSLPLNSLPPTVIAPMQGAIRSLAQRNLIRGKRLGLPAGQDVAKAMGFTPISNARLGLKGDQWGGKAPLWFYILREAELYGGKMLGPVGGTIVAHTIIGILAADPYSYFNSLRRFTPMHPNFGVGHMLLKGGSISNEAQPGG